MTDTTKHKMLQSWANYLLGGSQESQGTMAEGVIEEASHTPTLDHLLRGDIDVEHSDDEWVLISADHLETSDGDFDEVEVTLRRVPSVRELLTRTSSSSSLHSNDIDVEVRNPSYQSILNIDVPYFCEMLIIGGILLAYFTSITSLVLTVDDLLLSSS